MNTTMLFQDNAITKSRYELSALELNIFFHVLRQIRFEKSTTTIYQIDVKDVIDQDKERPTNHTALRKATRSLISKVIDIPVGIDGSYIQSSLVSAVNYQTGSGRMLVQVSDMIKPYLIDVAKNTTRYYFEIAVKLKSLYAKRFYQFIAQWRTAGTWKVSYAELRSRLQLEKRYKNYGDFKIYVINAAHEELMLHGDIYFTYKEIKQGRRVTDFVFTILENTNFSRQRQQKEVAADNNTTAEVLYPLDPNRLIYSLKQLELAPWQITNVLKTFEQNGEDLFNAIYQINLMPTIKSKGAKAWGVFQNKYQVPNFKMK